MQAMSEWVYGSRLHAVCGHDVRPARSCVRSLSDRWQSFKRISRILLGGCATLVLSGCASVSSSWAPFPSQGELMAFEARVKAKQSPPDLATLKPELLAYRDEIYAAALTRSKLEWESAGMATYGGLASVAGGLASKIALVNVGAGVASLGLINSSFYRFPQQTQIYLVALKRVSCILGKVNVVDDTLLTYARLASDPTASNAAVNFVQTTMSAVDFVRVEYTGSLIGLTPSIPSKEEMMAAYGRFRPATPAAAASGADPNQQLYDQAGESVRALVVEIQACSKL